jgi:serine/threonine protein kinase
MTWFTDEVVGHLRHVATWPELPSDRYVLLRPIGRGGMGAVYIARDERLGREVAIKVTNAISADSGLDRRLQQEAQVLARLEHPGIVPVHDAGVLADGRAFYVMKLVRGETLAEHATTLHGEAPVLSVFERVAETVAFAHASGVVHRDLNPSNVMVGGFGEVLVLDWGVAKLMEVGWPAPREVPAADVADGSAGTASGTRIGTAGFMAPEQQRGDSLSAGPDSDVYSLGALLFWMLTRTVVSDPDVAADVLARRDLRVGRRLRAIVLKCLAVERGGRYADARALVDDLARYRAGLSISAYRESGLERTGRWLATYRTFVLLIAAYLVMRALFVWLR